MLRLLRTSVPVIFDVLGLLTISYGVFLIFLPAGIIVLGISFLLLGYRTQSP